jgi:hypothetical protein
MRASSLKNFILAIGVAAGAFLLAAQPLMAQVNSTTFNLLPNPKFVDCLGVSGGPTPEAKVTVYRGTLNDTLIINARNIKPGLGFDMFTVERSNLLSDGTVDPNFTNFGLAWYQSDLEAGTDGRLGSTIKTIILDQIFGFDADLSNPNPINAFHVGFWFDDPNAAAACGFDPSKPTPFNGQHQAGPVAMISVPDATTNLGPLCTNPNTDTNPATCNP